MTEQPKSFYDNVWDVISSKVGNNTDADFLTDRIMDLIKDNIPKPKTLLNNHMDWIEGDLGWNVCLTTMKDSMGIIDVKTKKVLEETK
jgi:hypothetical protein